MWPASKFEYEILFLERSLLKHFRTRPGSKQDAGNGREWVGFREGNKNCHDLQFALFTMSRRSLVGDSIGLELYGI